MSGAAEADPLVQRVQETHLEQHRKVLIPVDHSQHAEDAFKCKYLEIYTWYRPCFILFTNWTNSRLNKRNALTARVKNLSLPENKILLFKIL